jgi:hypothetical protein
MPTEVDEADHKFIDRVLRKENVVLLGITASQMHSPKRKTLSWYAPVTILAEAPTLEKIIKGRDSRETPGSEVVPRFVDIANKEGKIIMRVFETAACHSYHAVGDIQVASIPTLLQFFLAYLYAGAVEDDITHLLCVSQRLVDLAHSKPKRRFALLTPASCLGHQETLTGLRKHKAVLYETYSKKKSSADFLKYFFTYNPRDTATRRKRAKDGLRKTRKARLESSY